MRSRTPEDERGPVEDGHASHAEDGRASHAVKAGTRFHLDQAVWALREHGLRLTPLKRAVLETFAGGECALTAEELGARVGVGTDLSPLYRCLASLEDAGILTHFYVADGSRRYDPADEFGSHHHHLVCVRCSDVTRVDGCALSGEIAAEAAALGYLVRDHEVVLKGICPGCRGDGSGALGV